MQAVAELPTEPFALRFTHKDAAECWPVVGPLLTRACDYSGGRYAPEHVMQGLAEGVFQLWGVARGPTLLCVCVTHINNYPTGLRTLDTVLLGGNDADAIFPFIKTLSTFAVDNQCDRVEWIGRTGFKRKFPDARVVGNIFELDV